LLQLLDRPVEYLLELASLERRHSRDNYKAHPLDPQAFERLNPAINIYLTGDNTRQPREKWVAQMLESYEQQRETLIRLLAADRSVQEASPTEQWHLPAWPSPLASDAVLHDVR
jgi:hypothetical protein